MNASKIVLFGLIIASFLIAGYFYQIMPNRLASHWNAQGEVDGYSGKIVGLFLVPCLMLFFVGLFWVIPRIDPMYANYAKFQSYYQKFLLVLVAFMFYVFLLTIFWNTGSSFNMIQAMVPAFAALFFYSGVLIERAKRNWFVGIRTPWTLSSESIWKKTHDVGGRLFKACGVVSLLGLLFPMQAIWIILIPLLCASAYTFIYSYMEYKKEKREKSQAKGRKRK